MRFRRWVVFTVAIHILVILLDKGAGLVLFKILEDEPNIKGALDLLTQLPFIMMAVANLGLATSSVYYLRKGKFAVQKVAETTSLVAIVWGGFVALLAFGASQTILPMIQPDWDYRWEVVVPICACVPFLLTSSYMNSVQLAVERVRDYNLVHLIASLTFLPLFFVFYFGVGALPTDSIADARLASAVLVTFVTLYLLRGVARWRPRMHWDFFKDGITYGWKANIVSVMTYLNHRIDLFLLGVLFLAIDSDANLSEVAFYSTAVSFAELVWHFPEATRDLFFSKVAGATHEEAKRFTPILCRLSLWGSAVGGAVLFFLIDPLMSVISPEAWSAQWQETVIGCYVVLIPGTVFYTVAKVLQADLAGRGHLNHCIVACSIVLVVMLSLDFALIPEQGAIGAAYASSIAYATSAVYSLVAYRTCNGGSFGACLVPHWADREYVVELFAAVREKLRGKKT